MWIPSSIEELEIAEGKIQRVNCGGKDILISRSGGKLFACGAICPHQGTSMEGGWIFDNEITCPEHSWVFSLETGALTWPGTGPRIPVYPVKVNDGIIELEID